MHVVRIMLMLAGISLAFLLPAQNGQTYELGGITVKGTVASDELGIIALTGLRVGDKVEIPGSRISSAIKALWKQGIYEDVQISLARTVGEVAFLEVEVQEAVRLNKWSIKGEKRQVREKIESLLKPHLVKGKSWTPDIKNKIRQIIYGYFQEDGYAYANVEFSENYHSKNHKLDLEIKIDRGARQRIHEIQFAGNKRVNNKRLRKQMELKAGLIKKSKFVASALEQDKEMLLHYYQTEGFKDAAILGDSIWKDEKDRLHLLVNIHEGAPYTIGTINWIGNSIYSTELLQKMLGMEKGDAYNRPLLEERLLFSESGTDISSMYMDRGYLFFQIEPIEKGIEGEVIDLEIRISEGPLASIGEVKIKGNTRTNEHVIRRELETQPGQVFNRSAIIRSQRRLMAMGYFNPESLGVSTEVNPEKGTVDITYEVEETRNEKLELSAGWNPATEQIVGTIGLNLNNFSVKNLLSGKNWSPLPSGDGQTLSMRLQSTGREYQAANFTFSEPWLGGKRPNLFTVAGFYQRYTNGATVGSEDFTSLSVGGGSIQLGTRFRILGRPVAFSTKLNAEHIYLNNYRDILLDDGSTLSSGRFNNIYIQPKLVYATLGDPFFPRRGIKAMLSAQFTPPFTTLGVQDESNSYRWLEYHKWRFELEGYVPIAKKLVLKGGWKMGWLSAYNAADGTPPFERFELGGNGMNSEQAGFVGNDVFAMRGYNLSDFDANARGGGSAFAKATVELRYELVSSQSLRAYVLGFAEAGNLWNSGSEINPFDMKPAVGAGLRLQLPMFGTLGFDYGLGFQKPELSGSHWSKYGTFNIILGLEPE